MKLTLNTAALCAALRSLDKITPSKAVLPILSHVLIHAELNTVWLSCTDTELSCTRHVAAQIAEAGHIALPCRPLLDIVSQITDTDVHLFSDKSGVRIAAGSFKLRLQSLPADTFPELHASIDRGTLLHGATVRALLRKVRPCIGSGEKRYNINGALLVLSESVLACVATDGKRLSVATAAVRDATPCNVVLPTKLIDTLLQDDGDDYAFSHTDNHLFFATEYSALSSRKIDGQFPNYQRMIPTTHPFTCSVPRELLHAALKRVSLVAGAAGVVSFNCDGGTLQCAARSIELGDAVEHVAVTYTGDAISVNLHAPAALDFLESAQQPHVTLTLKDGRSAVLLSDGSDFITVAMSVRA